MFKTLLFTQYIYKTTTGKIKNSGFQCICKAAVMIILINI